jgi:hypothetical protein
MDELTFQHQLRELKQRVSDMAATSSSWMPPRPPTHPGLAPGVAPKYHQDLYTAQLRDVKHKLDCMQQASFPRQWLGPAVQTNIPFTAMPESPDRLDYFRQDIRTLAGTIEASNDRAIQNFADFKRQFATLDYEMRSGFANLGFAVSQLGRSTAFTPDSSEATDEDLTVAHEGFPVDAAAVPDYGYDESGTAVNPEDRTVPWFETNNLPQPITKEYSDYLASQIAAVNAGQKATEEHKNNPDQKLAPQIATFHARQQTSEEHARALNKADHMGHTAWNYGAVSFRNHHELVDGEEKNALSKVNCVWLSALDQDEENALPTGRPTGFEGVTQLIQETCPRPAVLSEPFMAVCPPKIVQNGQSSYDHGNFTEGGMQHEGSWSHLDTSSPEKAQLKVEQITNQQLRDAIAAKDELIADLEVGQIADRRDMAEKDAAIAHLSDSKSAAEKAVETTRSDLEKRLEEAKNRHEYVISQLDMEFERLGHELKQCEASRHHFMTKYVDENYRFKWLEQRKLQSEQRLQQQLNECEAALENCNRGRHIDIRNALHSSAGEVDKLQMFCEEKDAVVYQQEQIIAQGASILQERDAEIDRLSAALDESKRSEQDAREHAAKNKRTIQKRDLQLEDLQREAKGEKERRCRLEDLMRRDAEAMRTKAKDARFDADERDSGRSFANAGNVPANVLSRGQSGRQNPLWTPQPIPSGGRLPHEEDRASFWEDGEHAQARATTKHKFGSPSPMAQRRALPGRYFSEEERDAREHSKGQHRQNGGMYPDPSRHQSEPLASNREALQLLAGWTERTLQEQQKNSRLHEQRPLGPPQLARQTHADMSHQRPGAGGGNGGGRRSPSSRTKAQAPTNGGSAENGRHALPLDTTWLPAAAQPAAAERVGSVPDLRAGGGRSETSTSRNHAAKEHGAMSKPASMFDLRPQKRHMPSPRQTYRAPSVETEAEGSSADEREQRQQRNSLVDYS